MYRFLESPIGQRELLEIKELQESGRITNLYNILNMSAGDVALFKRIMWLVEHYSQSDNMIGIGKLRYMYGAGIVYVSVRDLKAFKLIIDNFRFNMQYENVRFVENVSLSKINQFREWSLDFCIHKPKEEVNDNKSRVTMKQIKIGKLHIDEISFDVENKNVAESIKTAINELVKAYQESIEDSVGIMEQISDEQSATVEEKPKSKKETCGIISEDELTRLISKSFDGCEMISSSINHNNITQSVLDILPEIKPFIMSCSQHIYNIVITNTGVVFLADDKQCYILSMRDGKRETRQVNGHFLDMMLSDTNRNGIAIEIELYRM